MYSEIHGYIFDREDEIIDLLRDMTAIESVIGEPQKDAPYGKGCADMLFFTEKVYKENGFDTELHQDKGYLLARLGENQDRIGLFAHGDVVPVSDDWIFTKPFEMLKTGDTLIGRGVLDDKSGIIISLYVAKLVKELKLQMKHGLLMFTGVNEESGMGDMRNYAAEQRLPSVSFVPDTAFPCYNGDKAIIRFWANAGFTFNDILEVNGGKVFNAVLGKVTAKIRYSKELYTELSALCDGDFAVCPKDDYIEVTATGISTHAALPEGSVNAGYLLFSKLSECDALDSFDRQKAEYLAFILKSYYGDPFGIQNDDCVFGKLTCVNGMIKTENGRISLSFDIRCGTSVGVEETETKVRECLEKQSFTLAKDAYFNAFYLDERHPLVSSVLKAYKDFTGKDETSQINAGGTYAKFLPVALETGTGIWHEPEVCMPAGHGGCHQPDECISVKGLLEAIELTARYVLEADKL